MAYFYTDPEREQDLHALPDIETWWGYNHQCETCSCEQPLTPDYYGVLYQARARCAACGTVGSLKVTDTARKWWYAFGSPGCLCDSGPVGPFDTEAEALEAAREVAQ